MNKEVAARSQGVASAPQFDREQVDLIKQIYAKGATDNELRLFLSVCKRTGLDPFARQIYFVKRGNMATIQTGIDGFRSLAAQTMEHVGDEGPFWCGSDGKWVDVWVSAEPPVACKVGALRKGCTAPFWGVAKYAEYYAQSNPLWQRMPTAMLEKCAESKALRKAFPQQLSGLYTEDEMAQASNGAPSAVMAVAMQPGGSPEAGSDTGQWMKAMIEGFQELKARLPEQYAHLYYDVLRNTGDVEHSNELRDRTKALDTYRQLKRVVEELEKTAGQSDAAEPEVKA